MITVRLERDDRSAAIPTHGNPLASVSFGPGRRGEVFLVKLGFFLVLAEHLRGVEGPSAKLGKRKRTKGDKTKGREGGGKIV